MDVRRLSSYLSPSSDPSLVAGFSRAVIRDRAAHILAQLEKHSPKNERYTLVSKVDNVGVALLVYAKDDGVARQISDVQTAWTGCGPLCAFPLTLWCV